MNKLIQYSAKLSLAGAVALALFVLGGTSIFAPAFATHELGHDEIARGKIGALEERVWSCENDFAPCASEVGAPGVDGPLANLVCLDGQTVAWNESIGGFVCSDGGGSGGAAAAHLSSHAHDHIVFITSTTYTGDLVAAALLLDANFVGSGVDAANAICASHAVAAALQGVYLAWIATGDDDAPAATFFHYTGAIVRTDNVTIADDWADLTNGDPLATGTSPFSDEFGILQISEIMTAVFSDGTYDAPCGDCLGWPTDDPPTTLSCAGG